MKIIYFIASSDCGDVEKSFIDICNSLYLHNKIKIEVILYKNNSISSLFEKNIKIHYLTDNNSVLNIFQYYKIYKITKDYKADIIHTFGINASEVVKKLNKFINVIHIGTKYNSKKNKILNKLKYITSVSKETQNNIKNTTNNYYKLYKNCLENSKKIAIIRFSAIGDIAASLPVLRALKYKPTIITTTVGYELLKDEFNDFIILENKNLFSILKLIFKIRKRKFFSIFDLQCNDRSRLITSLLNTKAYNNNGINFQNSFQNFSDIIIKSNLLNSIDMTFKKKKKNYIVLNCGSSNKWLSKRLPFEKWKEISEILYNKYKLTFYLTGDKSEKEYILEVSKYIIGEKQIMAGETTLQELKKILSNAFLTVSTDSAAMHISAVQKTPTIGIFGPTNWVRSAPYGPWSTAIYDHIFYPDNLPPTENLQVVDKYFKNIDIRPALKKLSDYLDN